MRYVIYGVLWVFTFGKLNFWLLPNLTAECGFFESFLPVYEYHYKITEEEKPIVPKNETMDVQDLETKVRKDTKPSDSGVISDVINNTEDSKTISKDESDDESSGSQKEEWIKVKKVDTEEQEEREEIKC